MNIIRQFIKNQKMDLTQLHKQFGTHGKCIDFNLEKNAFEQVFENKVKGEPCMLNYKSKGDVKEIDYRKGLHY